MRTNILNAFNMYKRKKTQKRIKKLEAQIHELQTAKNVTTTNEKKSSKREFFISIIGIAIAVIGAFIAWKQIEISENQNQLVNSQVEISKQQAEFQELDIYKSFLTLDQNDKNEVNKFIDYIDLLDSETADKLLYKFSNLGVSYLSISALNTYYTRLDKRNKNGLSGNELADFILKLNSKIDSNAYCMPCFSKNFKETLYSVIRIKNELSFDQYRKYVKIIRNDIPLNLIQKIIEFEFKNEHLFSYDIAGDDLLFEFDRSGYAYLRIFTIPTSVHRILDKDQSSSHIITKIFIRSIHLSILHRELVKSSSKLTQKKNVFKHSANSSDFMRILDLYLETFSLSKSIESLKYNAKISAEIIRENVGWDCSEEETVDYIQFWLQDGPFSIN